MSRLILRSSIVDDEEPPVEGDELTSFTITSAVGGTNLPFTIGHSFKQGDIPDGSYITSDLSGLQADVQNVWSDGSVKFALLSGRKTVSTSASTVLVEVTPTAPSGTDLTLTGLRAALTSGALVFTSGITATADIPTVIAGSPFKTRITGPTMSEWHWRTGSVGSNAHLVVWFYIRFYVGGEIEIETVVENGYLAVASPTSISYTATLTINGSQRYNGALVHLHHSRWSRKDWYGTDPQIVPSHDTDYLASTGLVPAFGFTSPSSGALNGLTGTYAPFDRANMPSAMGSGGSDTSIGLLPLEAALYCTSGDARAYNAVVAAGRSLGTYALHYRDENTNLPLKFSDYPNKCLNGTNSGFSGTGSSATSDYTPTPGGTAPATWASSHHPQSAYLAYLITGRYLFMEELQFMTTAHYLESPSTARATDDNILDSTGAGTIRRAAWCLRTLAMAAAMTPDADTTLRDEFQASWAANMVFYAGNYIYGSLNSGVRVNDLGAVLSYQTNGSGTSEYEPGGGHIFTAAWMQAFLGAVMGWTWDMEPTVVVSSGVASQMHAARTDHKVFRDFTYKHVVGLHGDDTGFNYRRGGPFAMLYTSTEQSNPPVWYANWAAVYTAFEAFYSLSHLTGTGTLKQAASDSNITLSGDTSTWPEGYHAIQMPHLSYAVDHGAPGADAAYARVLASSSYTLATPPTEDVPNWGRTSRTDALAPAWFLAQTDSTWLSIASVGTIDAVTPSPRIWNSGGSGGSPGSICDAWTGGAVDQHRGEYLFVANGGHADYAGNEGYGLVLKAETPAWKRLTDPTPNASVLFDGNTTSSGAVNSDGRPRSNHNSNLIFAEGKVWQSQQNFFSSPGGGVTFATWSYDRDMLGTALTPLAHTGANLGPWTFHELADVPVSSASSKSSIAVFDRVRRKIYNLAGSSENNSAYWDVIVTPGGSYGLSDGHTSSSPSNIGSWDTWAVCAWDLGYIFTGDQGSLGPRIIALNLATGVFTVVSNITGTPIDGSQGDGGVYIQKNHTILCGNPQFYGGTIYKLQIPTTTNSAGRRIYDTSGQWTWTNSTPSGGPTTAGGKVYSKWNIVEDMGNGQSALVVCVDIADPTYVYKIPKVGP